MPGKSHGASFAPPFDSVERRGPKPVLKVSWGLLQEEGPLEELSPGRHPGTSNTFLLLASSWAVPLSPRNVFARIAKERGDTRPCLWNFSPLSRSGGLLLYKQTCSFQIQTCKHTPGGCHYLLEEGSLSTHPVNSQSQPPGKAFLGVPFLGAVIPEFGAMGSSLTLTGKGEPPPNISSIPFAQ